MTKQRYFFLILILGTLTALGPFSIDMYLPGFPAIAKYLHTTVPGVGLSVSSFFFGLAFGQLLYGPLLDKFGRKRPLYFGLCFYIVASVGCAMSTSLNMLIIMRVVQALGSCAAAVASIAMVRDLFPVNENAKVFALLMLVVGASPMIAPAVGGYITEYAGWQWIFIILAVMAAVILIMVIFALPNGYKPDSSLSLKPLPIIAGFWKVMKNPQFYTYALTGAFAFSGLFAYVTGSPRVFMEVFGQSKTTFGWIFAGLSVGFIGSSQLNNLFLKKFSSEQIVRASLTAQTVISAVILICALNGMLGIWSLVGFMFLFLSTIGITNPNTSALSLAPFEKNAGTASALLGALQLGIGAVISTSVGFFNSLTVVPLAIVLFGSSIVAFVVLFASLKVNRNKFVTAKAGAGVVVH